MIHLASPQSWLAMKICFVLVDFEMWEWMDGRTTCVKTVITLRRTLRQNAVQFCFYRCQGLAI